MKIDHLHSIYFSTDSSGAQPLPDRISLNIDSVRRCYPEAQHTLYDLQTGRQFLVENMTPEVVKAFDDLVPFAYKSDLLRYALLYVRGGLYADLSVQMFYPLPEAGPKTEVMVFREGFSAAPWAVSTSLIASSPGQALFSRCIDAIIGHIATGFYGTNPLCPTGPNLFGATLAAEVPLYALSCGEATRINLSSTHSYAYRDAHGDVVAVNIKRGTGLSSLGASHRDDYNEHYRNRTIYAHELNAPKVWSFADFVQHGWLQTPKETESEHAALMACGPYTTLDAGTYRATFTLGAVMPEDNPSDRLVADVCKDLGRQIIPVKRQFQGQSGDGRLYHTVEFELENRTSNVEVRLFAVRPEEFHLISLSIDPLP